MGVSKNFIMNTASDATVMFKSMSGSKSISMKCLLLVTLLVTLNACNKDHKINNQLFGTWVEKTHRQDSLEVYRSGNRMIMFDNSTHYRMRGGLFPEDKYFRHQVVFRNDSIGFKLADAPDRVSHFFYFFRWDNADQFTMSYNGLRPYLSSIGTLTYERVRK